MGDGSLPPGAEALLRRLYDAFNARRPASALASIRPEALWPSADEAGHDVGHDAVQAWWARQYEPRDARISPRAFRLSDDGYSIIAEVHQVVRDERGEIVIDRRLDHVYILHLGTIVRMAPRPPAAET